MARFAVVTAPVAFGGPAYEVRDEDGVSARFDYFVAVDTAEGTWVHPKAFRGFYEADVFAAKVAARGAIDPDHWDLYEEGPSLEERWEEEAHREALERAGYC
jgi:hypothetical protein